MRSVVLGLRLLCLGLLLSVGFQAWNLSGEETTLSALDQDLVELENLFRVPEVPDPASSEEAAPAAGKADGKKDGQGTAAPTDAGAQAGKGASPIPAVAKGAGKPADPPAKEKTASRTLPAHYEIISRSGIFGVIPKKRLPPPGLEGIAGGFAFIRAPNGATGLVEEGGEYQGIKVLKIGTNRVLIRYQDKTQELTLHSGLGGESLMPPPEKTTEKGKP